MKDSLFKELRQSNLFKVATVYILTSGFLLQIGDIIFEAFDVPLWIMRGLLILLVLGFILALMLTVVYESRIKNKSSSLGEREKPDKKLHIIVPTGLFILIIAVFFFQYRIDNQSISEKKNEVVTDNSAETRSSLNNRAEKRLPSIAVLPFVNISDDAANEYFSDGISEEILNVLAKIPNLQVAARTSSFQFKNKNKNIQDIASQLGVTTILEGSIRKDGNKVRITAQLIQADNGFHMWSESYDRELDNIFKVQDEIAAAIVESLKETLGVDLKIVHQAKAPVDHEVYDYYLKGLQALREFNFRSLVEAKFNFEQALALESSYIPAQISLAETLLSQIVIGSESDEKLLDDAIVLLQTVLTVDTNIAETYHLLSRIESFNRNEALAAKYFKQAYEIDPKSSLVITTFAAQVNNPDLKDFFDETTTKNIFNDVLIRDPLNDDIHNAWGQIQLALYQNYDEAERSFLRAIELNPENPSSPYGLALFYGLRRGDLVNTFKFVNKSSDSEDPDIPIIYSRLYLSFGDKLAALDYADVAIKTSPKSANAARTKVVALQSLGRNDEALALINSVLQSEDYFYRNGAKSAMVRIAVYILLSNNEYIKAEDFFYTHYSKYKDMEEPIYIDTSTRTSNEGLDVYVALLMARADDKAKQQLSKITINITEEDLLKRKTRLESFDYFSLGLLALSENPDLSIDYFEKSFENGLLLDWYQIFVANPLLIKLQDKANYIALIKRIKNEATMQYEIVKSGNT